MLLVAEKDALLHSLPTGFCYDVNGKYT